MMTYTLVWDHMKNQVHDGVIKRDEDGAFIPMDADNIDCQKYMAWLDEGNEPASVTPPSTSLPEAVPVEDRVSDLEDRVNQLEDSTR